MIFNNKNFPSLPSNWAKTTVDECCSLISINKKKVKAKEYKSNGKYPIVDQGQDLIGGYYDSEDFVIKTEKPLIIFGDHTRALKYVDFDFIPGADGTKVIEPKESLYPKLLFYFLRAILLPDKGYARHFQFLRSSFIALPPLAEQKRIAAKLDSLLPKVDACKARLDMVSEIIKRFRRSVLGAATSGRLTEDWREENPDVESAEYMVSSISSHIKTVRKRKENFAPDPPPYELPENWKWVRLGNIAHLRSGKSISQSDELEIGDYKYVKVADMNLPENLKEIYVSRRYVMKSDSIENSLIPAKSIIFPKRGGAIATNKKRIVIEPIMADLNIMAILCPEEFELLYLYHWFVTIDLSSLNTGSTVPQINNSNIEPLYVPVPPLEEQKEIVRRVEALLGMADQLEEKLNAAKSRVDKLTPSILAKAFRGELVPQDPDDEPAELLLQRIRAEKEASGAKTKKGTRTNKKG